MIKYFLLLLLPVFIFGCKPRPVPVMAEEKPALREDESFEYQDYPVENVQRPAEYTFVKDKFLDSEDYIPDTTNARYLPIRYLMVNLHIMNTTDTLYPYFGEEGEKYAREVIGYCNVIMNRRAKSWLMPDSMDVPALPTRLLFNIAKKPDSEEYAIYEHYDDELYWYLHNGQMRNRADRAVIEKYGINRETELNIFVMGPPRDSVESPSFRLSGADGIFLGDAIKITGWLSRNKPAWEIASLVAHEIGHALGLNHAWTKSDGCDDTPPHRNASWSLPSSKRGPGLSSNNLMDYSNRQEALTPCQIGRMHARMSDITGPQRKWLLPYWCRYNPNEPVRVTKDLNWEGARDFNTDIFVKRGSTLRINNRLHLPDRAAIYVDPGGRLLIGPDAILHSDCGGQWAGIRVGVTESGVRGEIVIDEQAIFMNEATNE